MKKVVAIRGAVCTENTKEDIILNVCNMVNEIILKNKLEKEDLISLHFTVTKEITKLNPATALRKGKLLTDITDVALFCSQEAYIENGMKNVIRLMLHTYMDENLKKQNVYLNGAQKLRPDYSDFSSDSEVLI